MQQHHIYFLLGALGCALACILHLACIVFGASWYRFFGAGEKMLKMVAAGSPYPSIITLFISLILAIWTCYGLAAAGLIPTLPLQNLALSLISAVLLLRGLGFYPLMKKIKGNSLRFWIVSSAICSGLGTLFLLGLVMQNR